MPSLPAPESSLLVPVRPNVNLRLVLPPELCLALSVFVLTNGEEFITTDFEEADVALFDRALDVIAPDIGKSFGVRAENLALLPPVVRRYTPETEAGLLQPRIDTFADYGIHVFLQKPEQGGNVFFPGLRFSTKVVPEGWGVFHPTTLEYGISKPKGGEVFILSFWLKEDEESSPEASSRASGSSA